MHRGRVRVFEHDDVAAARRMEPIRELVHQHAVADLERRHHGLGRDVEGLDQEGFDEQRQDEGDQQQHRQLAEKG